MGQLTFILGTFWSDLLLSSDQIELSLSLSIVEDSSTFFSMIFNWHFFKNFCVLFQVHGEGTPAGRARLLANDAIKYVDDKDVTVLTHNEVVQLIKSHSGLKMTLVVERFSYILF